MQGVSTAPPNPNRKRENPKEKEKTVGIVHEEKDGWNKLTSTFYDRFALVRNLHQPKKDLTSIF